VALLRLAIAAVLGALSATAWPVSPCWVLSLASWRRPDCALASVELGSSSRPLVPPWCGARRPCISRIERHFIQNTWLDPGYWIKDNYVNNIFEPLLPRTKKGAELTLLEIEPIDGRYWSYLKRTDSRYYITDAFALTSSTEKEMMKDLKFNGIGIAAVPQIVTWEQKKSFLKAKSLDMVLLADGCLQRLGRGRVEMAFREARRVLKDEGRLYFVLDKEDEKLLGCSVQLGFEEGVIKQFGFEVASVTRDQGLLAGCMTKKPGGVEPGTVAKMIATAKTAPAKKKGFQARPGRPAKKSR